MFNKIITFGSLFVAVIITAIFFDVALVQADAAPPLTPPGSTIDPSSTTPVQMWSERVELDATGLLGDEGKVHVHAVFRMRNTASSKQSMRVRFPLEHPAGIGDGYGLFPIVENFSVLVDSELVETSNIIEPSYWDRVDESIKWSTFDVSFPVGEDVIIAVEYDIKPMVHSDFSAISLDYVLETGAGWFGPICLADIVLHLPYPANKDNYISENSSWPTPKFSGNSIIWRRWNLEPTREDNFYVTLIQPPTWQRIRQLETLAANGQANHNDYFELSRLYWGAGTDTAERGLRPRLIDSSERAARMGLMQNPSSSELLFHLAYIRWIRIANFFTHSGRSPTPSEKAQINKIVNLFQEAFNLDPSNQRAQNMADFIKNYSWDLPTP